MSLIASAIFRPFLAQLAFIVACSSAVTSMVSRFILTAFLRLCPLSYFIIYDFTTIPAGVKIKLWPSVIFFFFLLSFVAFGQVPAEPVKAGPWVRLPGCELVSWEHNDGDSFRVRLPSGEDFVARLYFVDAPEDSLAFPDRVQDQADYFGVSVPRALEIAKEATAFVDKSLAQPFTVWTRWRLGGGRGVRWAVMIQDGRGGIGPDSGHTNTTPGPNRGK